MHSLFRHAVLAATIALVAVTAADPNAPYETAQRRVAVDGSRHLNLYCSGSGTPTVILDAAIGSTTYVWHAVQPQLAQRTRVCSYDRAGYGFSDSGGPAHTTDHNVDDLHALLENAKIAPPYLLVAHSLNAFDARVFADRYRGEVAGMVLLDPSEVDEDRFGAIYGAKKYAADEAADRAGLAACARKADRHALKPGDDCVEAPDPHLPAALNRIKLEHSLSAATWDAALSEEANVGTDLGEVRSEQRMYGQLPLIVLWAGAAEDAEKQMGATGAQIAAAKRLWRELHGADAAFSQLGVACTVPGAGHYLQLERPAVVVDAVLEIIQQRGRPQRPACSDSTAARKV